MNQHHQSANSTSPIRGYLNAIMTCPTFYPHLYRLPLQILVPELKRLHNAYQDSPLSYLESYYRTIDDIIELNSNLTH